MCSEGESHYIIKLSEILVTELLLHVPIKKIIFIIDIIMNKYSLPLPSLCISKFMLIKYTLICVEVRQRSLGYEKT
jgi:hypothetical protein